MIESFEVGLLMGTIIGAGLYHGFMVVHAWWQSIHPPKLDWDPTIERIRRL